MKKLFVILALCACIAGASVLHADAQRNRIKASKNYITRDIPNFGSFDAIRAEGVADIEYTQTTDGTTSVKVYGSDNVLDHLEVVNEGGTLVARTRKNTDIILNNGKLKVIASSPALIKVSSKGTGDIDLTGSIITGDLTLESSGTGDVEFNTITCDDLKFVCSGTSDLGGRTVTCKTLDMAISGTGDADIEYVEASSVKITSSGTSDVEIAGKATDVTIKGSGTGDVDAYGLRAETVNVAGRGTGDISCYATKRLDANASGLSSITYGGNPESVNISGNQKRVNPR